MKVLFRFPISVGLGVFTYFISGQLLWLACAVAAAVELINLVVVLRAIRRIELGGEPADDKEFLVIHQYIISSDVNPSDVANMIFCRIFACMLISFAVGPFLWLLLLAIPIFAITTLHWSRGRED